LINAAYNRRNSLVVVLDNGTTAMTGMQPNPFSGETLMGQASPPLDYAALATAVGIPPENVRIANAWKAEQIDAAIEELLNRDTLSLLVVKGPCVILKRRQAKKAGLQEEKDHA
jgi:indolepyruvate ferredoxin oxidoreductase alpha subunit